MRAITQEDGRSAFGADAANYDSARPGYPAWVYDELRARCGLTRGTRVFEIGPGTGVATRELLAVGADVTAIEPDARMARVLKERAPDAKVINALFEDAVLPDGTFDIGVSATAFHWVKQPAGFNKVGSLLKPGGWWAPWWNVFGDPSREDAFHDATVHLLTTPSQPPTYKHPGAMDYKARFGELESTGLFTDIDVRIENWTLVLNPEQTRALYATFSQFAPLEPAERERILDALAEIAARQFNGRVERNMVTALYTARRV